VAVVAGRALDRGRVPQAPWAVSQTSKQPSAAE
jgi:hypothetical protein